MFVCGFKQTNVLSAMAWVQVPPMTSGVFCLQQGFSTQRSNPNTSICAKCLKKLLKAIRGTCKAINQREKRRSTKEKNVDQPRINLCASRDLKILTKYTVLLILGFYLDYSYMFRKCCFTP